jgi:ABC-type molybdate transport system substrate-binding protein
VTHWRPAAILVAAGLLVLLCLPAPLRADELEGGERGDVFASADMDHPRRLAAQGRAGAVTVFIRNRLCALARPGLTATSKDLLHQMLDPAVRLGTSTPKADPSGDYAWAVFERAEALQAGARAQLEAKALMLTGGREAPAPSPTGRSVYHGAHRPPASRCRAAHRLPPVVTGAGDTPAAWLLVARRLIGR